jgi:hypothetical protein
MPNSTRDKNRVVVIRRTTTLDYSNRQYVSGCDHLLVNYFSNGDGHTFKVCRTCGHEVSISEVDNGRHQLNRVRPLIRK